MSAAESEQTADEGGAGPSLELPALTESETAETRMTYGDGRWMWFLVALWSAVLVGISVYAYLLLVPDLGSWGAP